MRKRERKEREGGKDLWATSLLLLPPASTLQCLRAPLSVTPTWTDKDGQQEAENTGIHEHTQHTNRGF